MRFVRMPLALLALPAAIAISACNRPAQPPGTDAVPSATAPGGAPAPLTGDAQPPAPAPQPATPPAGPATPLIVPFGGVKPTVP